MSKLYLDEDVVKWYEYYKEVRSTRKTAKYFGVSRPTIKRRFIELGLEIFENRKYYFKQDFFDFDTPESFYWAGFIAADGCICGNRLGICLGHKDKDHLEKFADIIEYDGPIREYDQRPVRNSISAHLQISSKDMVESLKKFNIGPRKSLTYRMPKWLKTHKLIDHFVRGYSDGDGCFLVSDKNKIFSVCGTEKMLEDLREIFSINCMTNCEAAIAFDSGIYGLQFSGRINMIKIRDFLYENSKDTIELTRKREICFDDRIGNSKVHKNIMPVVSMDKNGNIIKFYRTQEETKMDGFLPSKVSMCISGKRKKHGNLRFRKATHEEIKVYGALND